MSIKILAVGKKHEAWIADGVKRYEERLRKPLSLEWEYLAHSQKAGGSARDEESQRILSRLKPADAVVLLDERGMIVTSEEFSKKIFSMVRNSKRVVFVIGGAYGVNEELRGRADFMWSLSKLVFPHQAVRLLVAEQLYRAQEIAAGSSYHHA